MAATFLTYGDIDFRVFMPLPFSGSDIGGGVSPPRGTHGSSVQAEPAAAVPTTTTAVQATAAGTHRPS